MKARQEEWYVGESRILYLHIKAISFLDLRRDRMTNQIWISLIVDTAFRS